MAVVGVCRKYIAFKDFRAAALPIDPRYLGISRNATLVDGRIPWQLSGIENVVDYRPRFEENVVFSSREQRIARRGNRRNRAKSSGYDWPIFRMRWRTNAYVTSRRNGLLFSFAHLLLTWPMQPRWQHHRLGWWQPSVFPLPFRPEKIYLARGPRISGVFCVRVMVL